MVGEPGVWWNRPWGTGSDAIQTKRWALLDKKKNTQHDTICWSQMVWESQWIPTKKACDVCVLCSAMRGFARFCMWPAEAFQFFSLRICLFSFGEACYYYYYCYYYHQASNSTLGPSQAYNVLVSWPLDASQRPVIPGNHGKPFWFGSQKNMFGLLLVRVPKSNPKPPTTQTNNQSPVECWVVAREDFLHNTLMLEAASFCRMWHPYGLSVWVSSQRLPNQQLEGIMAKESG